MQLAKTLESPMDVGDCRQEMIMVGQHAPSHAPILASSQHCHEVAFKLAQAVNAFADDGYVFKVSCREMEDSVLHIRVRRPVPWPITLLPISQ